MKLKKIVEEYKNHMMICIGIFAIAFGINWKIDVVQNHQYAISNPTYTLLKEVTEAKVEGNKLVLCGWGFDTNYYDENSQCELILQDTETGEAQWLKMEKYPEPVQIADCYTDGSDYSSAGFQGSIRLSRLDENSVYEILLRYTSSYFDEEGNKQQYVKTVTVEQFLYQKQVMEYNPKTFLEPEIAGTGLEKELKNAKVFHYFPEGMWVYYDDKNLYYIIEKNFFAGKENYEIPVQWTTSNINNLSEERRDCGYGNEGFIAATKIVPNLETKDYIVLMTNIPADYEMYLWTGIYEKEKGWILQNLPKQFQFYTE